MAVSVVACGGGDSGTPAATEPAVTIAADKKAKDLLPDLGPLGYTIVQQEADPGAQLTGQDAYRAIYQKGQGPQGALVEIFLFPDENAAKQQFGALSSALKKPSAEFLGGSATFVDAPSPNVGDERKSYMTTTKDAQGNRAWTDLYRIGRLLVLTQTLDAATGDQLAVREGIVKQVQVKAR
ncbi:MAG: hypothetical protein HYX53_10510 [Chloroflexi bacterium]|nr:hypothetical protein [Chloroflexota bacterium]